MAPSTATSPRRAARGARLSGSPAARGRGRKRAIDSAASPVKTAATPVPVSPVVVPVELLSDDEGTLMLPIRFQCPLCFDVLRKPIQLPCCQRHLCQECFERALEITSVNCGFCRKRIVGFARKKQYKVDEALWTEIRRVCPFVAHADGAADGVVDIEFVDENAPPKHHDVADEATVAVVRAPEHAMPKPTHEDALTVGVSVDGSPIAEAVPQHQTRSVSSQKLKQQRRLDAFFGVSSSDSSRPSSADSMRSLRSTCSKSSMSSSSSLSSGTKRGRHRLDLVGKKKTRTEPVRKPLLRSASHSPKRRKPHAMQRTLLQLTLHSPTARVTRQSSASLVLPTSPNAAMTTRPRRPWRCRHCTYENTCFDTRCSMCQQYPASAPIHP